MDFRELVTVSGLALRNAAGTFLNTLTSATTAPRTWTFQDKDYTVAGLDDLTPANFTGILPVAKGGTGVNTMYELALAIGQLIYPVGMSIELNVATNPATLLGFGTWVSHGSGRVTVAIDTSQTEFNVLGETGGAKTHTLATTEIPSHQHVENSGSLGVNASDAGFAGEVAGIASGGSFGWIGRPGGATPPKTLSAGGGASHNNLQPYIVVYRWVRTA